MHVRASQGYLDFDSPVYVEMFMKLLRKASALTVVEMLPTPDDAWLPDRDRRHYASELRVIAVDPVPWMPH